MTSRQQAANAGDPTYRTGKLCRRGHDAPRYVSDGSCVACAVERAQRRYAAKTDAIREYGRARYWSDPERYRADEAQRRRAHSAACRHSGRREYQRNKLSYIERADRWRAENPEKRRSIGRNWARRHPDQAYGYVVRRRMAKLQRTPPWLTAEHRDEMAGIYRQSRELEKRTGVAHNVDHVVPLRGENVSGLHVPWNLQILTARQNRAKSNYLAEQQEQRQCQQ